MSTWKAVGSRDARATAVAKGGSPVTRIATNALLRLLSLSVGYGLLLLARWVHAGDRVPGALGTIAMAAAGMVGLCFLLLGALAPDRTVRAVWRAIGKGLVYLVMFS